MEVLNAVNENLVENVVFVDDYDFIMVTFVFIVEKREQENGNNVGIGMVLEIYSVSLNEEV